MVLSSPSISIIIPVYNVEKYLAQALRSVIEQTYTNIQIICIDDGSTDLSLSILREYALKDSRIEIYSQGNAGCSAARNLGIEKARGSFLMFVDSDDWIDSDTCEKALSLLQRENADLLVWGYASEFETHSKCVCVWNNQRCFENEQLVRLRRRLLGPLDNELRHPEWMDSLGSLCGKLYRADIFKNYHINFVDLAEIGSAEDVLANLYYFAHTRKVVYTPDLIYHYRKFNTSSQTSSYRPMLVSQWQSLFNRMNSWCKEFDDSEKARQALNHRIAYSIVGLGLNELTSNSSVTSQRRRISNIIHAPWYIEAVKRLDYSHLPIHWRFFFSCAKHQKSWFVFALLVIIKHIINK